MLLFGKTTNRRLSPANRRISPANIDLKLGDSPPLYQVKPKRAHSISPPKRSYSISPPQRVHSISPPKRSYSISISPPHQDEPKKYTLHYIRKKFNEISQPVISRQPKIGLGTKIGMAFSNFKRIMRRNSTIKVADVDLQLGQSSSSSSLRKNKPEKQRKPTNLKIK